MPGAGDGGPTAPAELPPEPWERVEELVYRTAPFLGLAVSAGLTVGLTDGDHTLTLALAAAVLGWMVAGAWRPGWAGRGPAASALFVGVLLAVLLLLCLLAPWFGFLAIAGYVYSGAYLSGRRLLAGVGGAALCASVSQAGGAAGMRSNGIHIVLLLLLFNLPVAGGFTYFAKAGDDATQRRKRAMTELMALNERLERLGQENAGLHAQLLVQAREAGVLDERSRMAREIHDTLAQGLTGIIAQLQAARGLAGEDQDRHLRTALDLARESLAEARRSVGAMAPRSLEGATLPGALEQTAGTWSARHGVPAEVRVTGTPVRLHGELEATLLRMAQEALVNVARHAAASRVVLTLSYLGDEVALDVRDDGSGFDPATLRTAGQASVAGSAPGSGFGLMAMRQRVTRLAGTLEIDSEPGGGTAVSARVPAIGS